MSDFHDDQKNLESMVILSASKLLGFILTFFIPFFLSRWLTVDDYGTYKQLILLWMIFLQIQNMGMDLGLFYFVKSDPIQAPIFSLNVTAVNFATTLITVWLLNELAFPLSRFMNNSDLSGFMPEFSLLLLFSIPTQHFEHYLISIEKIKWAVLLEGVGEILKSIFIIVGFYYFNSLRMVLLLLVMFYLAKLVCLVVFNLRAFRKRYLDFSMAYTALIKQIAFALPLGAARIFSAVIYFDKFIISSMFSVGQFAIYAVGCFDIPFIHTVLNTQWELSSMEMVVAHNKKNHGRLVTLWKDTARKISIIAIPITLFCLVFAYEIIVFIFSKRYESSVPFFRLFILTFLTNAFDCELLFRIFKRNTAFLKIQAFNLVLTVLSMVILGIYYGAFWALAGKVAASFGALALMLFNVRNFLDISVASLLPWKNMAMITVVSAGLSMMAYFLSTWAGMSGWVQLSISGSFYFSCLFFFLVKSGNVTSMELEYFKRKIILFKKQKVM